MGKSCAVADECGSGFCTDGVCCNVACRGPCVSCSQVGLAGTCWPVDAGTSDPHAVAWLNYWKRVGTSARTGIWHETYLVRAGEYEAVYGNMPPFGLGKAGRLVPVAESKTARERFRAAAAGPGR